MIIISVSVLCASECANERLSVSDQTCRHVYEVDVDRSYDSIPIIIITTIHRPMTIILLCSSLRRLRSIFSISLLLPKNISLSTVTGCDRPYTSGVNMGKRKRASVSALPADDDARASASRPDHALHHQPISPPAPDAMPCSSGMELLLKENSSHSVDSSDPKPPSSVMDIADSKILNDHNSIGHHHYGLGRSIFLKRSRHYFGHQYSRRNSANHANASTSHGKFIPVRDEKLSFKLASQCNSDSGRQAENREKPYFRTERIRASSLIVDAVSSEMVKMVCGICHKLLKRKPFNLGNTLSSSELSAVAVLVCGHFYHADCLEQRTCLEDRRDPTCPECMGLLSKDDGSKGQE